MPIRLTTLWQVACLGHLKAGLTAVLLLQQGRPLRNQCLKHRRQVVSSVERLASINARHANKKTRRLPGFLLAQILSGWFL